MSRAESGALDLRIIPLVRVLNRFRRIGGGVYEGMATIHSCEGHPEGPLDKPLVVFHSSVFIATQLKTFIKRLPSPLSEWDVIIDDQLIFDEESGHELASPEWDNLQRIHETIPLLADALKDFRIEERDRGWKFKTCLSD